MSPTNPKASAKAANSLLFIFRSTGSWEVAGTKKAGSGAFKLEFTGRKAGGLKAVLEPEPGPVVIGPRPKPKWVLQGEGRWVLTYKVKGVPAVITWRGLATFECIPTGKVSFSVKA